MNDSKLIEFLKTFSSRDWSDFFDYLKSPFHNKNADLVSFATLLYQHIKNENEQDLSIEKQAEALNLNEVNEKKIAYHMNHLIHVAEEFLAIKTILKDKQNLQIKIIENYSQRGLSKHYNHVVNKAKNELALYPYNDEKFLKHQYELAMTEYRNFLKQNLRRGDPRVQDVVDKFDVYFIYEKLKFNVDLSSRQQSLNEAYEYNFIEEVKSYIEKSNIKEVPHINIYYHLTLLFEKDGSDELELSQYQKLKTLILQNIGVVSNHEMKSIFSDIINFSIRKANAGNIQFFEELFEWYNTGFRLKILFEGEYISPWALKNYVTVGIKLGKIDLVEKNVKHYVNMLPQNVRDNSMLYNLGIIHFHKNEFDTAQRLLMKVKFDDIFYNLDTKRTLLKIYYETKEFMLLESNINAFKMFLRRNNTISKNYKEIYFNFLDVLSILIKQNKRKKKIIAEKINNYNLLLDKDWLLKKVEQW